MFAYTLRFTSFGDDTQNNSLLIKCDSNVYILVKYNAYLGQFVTLQTL